MKISRNWLRDYVNLPDSLTGAELAQKLSLTTVEVEGYADLGAALNGIVVGKVLTVDPHPNADRLKVCTVDIGTERVPVVCGGSNVVAGMLVAFAPIGATVRWHGEGDPIVLTKATIRGVESSGMICASTEIGLGELFPLQSEKEILDLSTVILAKAGIQSSDTVDSRLRGNDTVVGKPLAEFLGLDDLVLEIDNKSLSHRPDLWGHYGIAREVAALYKKELKQYQTKEIKKAKSEFKIKVQVEDTKLCPRYMAVALSGVVVGESPAWLKNRLSAAGVRSINNIVDITNYVMLDLGQPLHAFDAKLLSQKTKHTEQKSISVRLAKEGEELITLDGQVRKLQSTMLVIADEDRVLALAGVMGGSESGITNATTTIIFESANFAASSIRTTSTALGLRSDSSARFEKSLDPHLCALALNKAVELTLQLCPSATVASEVIDKAHFRLSTGPIEVPLSLFAQKIGVAIEPKIIIDILTRLGFEVVQKKTMLKIKIPTWRATKDISLPEDIIEEVLRVYGYSEVPSALPSFPIVPPVVNRLRALEHRVRQMCMRAGRYHEVYNYSFVSASDISALGVDQAMYLELDNPISKERPFLRRSLVSGLLANVIKNIEFTPEVRVFEIGRTYLADAAGAKVKKNDDALLPRQDSWCALAYASKKDNTPFWQARRMVELCSQELALPLTLVASAPCAFAHPARSARIMLAEQEVGLIYELHPATRSDLGIEVPVAVMELNLDLLAATEAVSPTSYVPLSEFPEVVRDVALVVPSTLTHATLITLLQTAHPLVKNAELFDVYTGEHVAAEHKSVAYRITYADATRTLTTDEVDQAHAEVIQKLEKECGAKVRK